MKKDSKFLCDIKHDMSLDDFMSQLEGIKQKYSEEYENLYVKRIYFYDSDFFKVYGDLKQEAGETK